MRIPFLGAPAGRRQIMVFPLLLLMNATERAGEDAGAPSKKHIDKSGWDDIYIISLGQQ